MNTYCLKRDYSLNIPQLLYGRMSENWLLKELGDIHWEMISKGLGAPSDAIFDSNGERLYASFVRIQWSCQNNLGLKPFVENDKTVIESCLEQFKTKMFLSNGTVKNTTRDTSLQTSMISIFSARKNDDNQNLVKGTPIQKDDYKVPLLKIIPKYVKAFFSVKNQIFSLPSPDEETSNKHYFYDTEFTILTEPLFTRIYEVEPYDDINGVGLLYFASYPNISDKCERHFFEGHILIEGEKINWASHAICIARDIHYYGNANPNEKLRYQLDQAILEDDLTIRLTSSLYREKDGQIIAKIFTVKKLNQKVVIASEIDERLEKEKEVSKKDIRSPFVKNEGIEISGEFPEELADGTVKISSEELSNTIIGFFNSVYESHEVNLNTDLRKLGVESIIYTELSEYLNLECGLKTNPSRFFGLYSIKEIIAYCLGKTAKEEKKREEKSENSFTDIAIISTCCRLPDANTPESFWKNLKEGISSIKTTPEDRWVWPEGTENKYEGIKHAGYLDDIDSFDSLFFEISPREAQLMDPQQRMLLQLTWELFENAKQKPSQYKKSNTGVFIGVSGSDYERVVAENDPTQEGTVTGNAIALLANRISYFYDFEGPSISIDTACSSSLVAIAEAVKALKQQQCDQAVVGGIHLMCHPAKSIAYSNANMLSKDGKCHTFDAEANGYVRGEGAVVMLLKPLHKAQEDGDEILGVIKSTEVNHGGYSGGVTVPNPAQQQKLITSAYKQANIPIETVSYIEAHGTGTKLGDPIEVKALRDAFEQMRKDESVTNWCSLGSVKTNIGHLEAASGIAGLLKVLLSMQNRYLPATLNFRTLNPHIELDNSPFKIQKEGQEWKSSANEPLRAGVSSFGIGGTNAHVVVEAYDQNLKLETDNSSQLSAYVFVLSALNQESLERCAQEIHHWIQKQETIPLASFAYTLQTTKEEFAERLAFTYKDHSDLLNKLGSFLLKEKKASLLYYLENTKQYKDIHKEESVSEQYIEEQNFEALAMFWSKGGIVKWEQLYDKGQISKIALPTYQFAKKRFWIGKKIEIKEKLTGSMNDVEKPENVTIAAVQDKTVTAIEPIIAVEKIKLVPLNQIAAVEKEVLSVAPYQGENGEDTELVLSQILGDLLYLEQEEISIDQTFVALGLDSILGVEFVKRINKTLGITLNTSKLYSYPSVKELANALKINESGIDTKKESFTKIKLRPIESFGDKLITNKKGIEEISIAPINKDYESVLKELLCDLLYVTTDELESEQTFAELGLDSILGVEFTKKIRKQWNIDFATTQLYSHPTLKELAAYLQIADNSNPVLIAVESDTVLASKESDKNCEVKDHPVSQHATIQKELLTLISELLYLEESEISDTQTFVTLGLDSILGVELVKKINKKWQLSMPTSQIYSYPCLVELSDYITVSLEATEATETNETKKSFVQDVDQEIINAFEEGELKNILAALLYLESEEVSTTDTFVSLGLDSILGIEFVKKINKEFGIQCATSLLYSYPTVSDLHAYLISNYSVKNSRQEEESKTINSFFVPVVIIGNIEKEGESSIEYHLSVTNTPSLKDHKVFNEYILPTDAYVELLYSFFREQLGRKSISLKQLRISEVLMAQKDEVVPVLLNLKKVGEGIIRFTIVNKTTQKVYVRGTIAEDTILIGDLIDRPKEFETKLNLEALTDWTKDILSDSYFQVRKSLEINGKFAKGVVAVTKPQNKAVSYVSQWLDGALLFAIQYAAIQQRQGKIDGVMYLPYRIEAIHIHALAQTEVHYDCHIICHEAAEDMFLFSIEITSDQGKLITIKNLEVRKIEQRQLAVSQERKANAEESKEDIANSNKPIATDVAIIGMSCRFPGAENTIEFWDNLKHGIDSVTEIDSEQWQDIDWYNEDPKQQKKSYSKWAGFIKDKDKFDSLFFGISPREAEVMDPQHRLFLQECWRTIEDAGYTSKAIDKQNVGVFVGASSGDYQQLLAQDQSEKEGFAFMGNSQAILAGRIAFLLNLKGPALTLDTACSSSLVAIDRAYQSIVSGETDMALAGGVKLMCTPLLHIWTSQVGMASKDGKCKTFDNKGDGIVSSEGVGVLFLKRLDAAIKDGDHIHAVIKGSGINQDGKTNGITAPNGAAQAVLQQRIYKHYNIDPATIKYVETHGTGTKLGDPIEIEALKMSFGAKSALDNSCALGSVKTNIGHAAEAAGVSGVIKTILMLKNKQLVPSLHFEQLNDEISLEKSPFYINTTFKPWQNNTEHLRRAVVSSFGFSGTNAHLVLEEYPESKADKITADGIEQLIVLSAKTAYSLTAQVKQMADYLKESKESLRAIAYTLQLGRDAMQERLAVIGNSKEAIINQLSEFLETSNHEVLRGTVEKRKGPTASIAQEEINTAILKKNYTTLAKAWISGLEIDWKLLYEKEQIRKVQLPTYAFEKDSYWVEPVKQNVTTKWSLEAVRDQLHPLVHRTASTSDGHLYVSEYSGQEIVYKDHIVDGHKVLAGVAYIEQASVALEQATGQRIWGLKDIFWQQPLFLNAQKEVFTQIGSDAKNNNYEIYTKENGVILIHGKGAAILQEPLQPEKINLNRLLSLTQKKTQGEEFYAFLKAKGFDLGASFRGIQEQYSTPEFSVSRIQLPLQAGYKMQPGALDSALQNALGWIMIEGVVQQALPFSMKTCYRFADQLPEIFWSYARKSQLNETTRKVQEYDVDILDEQGNVLVQFLQCVFLPVKDKKVKESDSMPGIQKVAWQKVPYLKNCDSVYEHTIVYLIGGNPILADAIRNFYEAEIQSIAIENEISTYIQIFEDVKRRLHTKGKTQLIVLGSEEEYEQYGFLSGMFKTLALEHFNFEGKVIAIEDFSIHNIHEIAELLNKERFNNAVEVKYTSLERLEKKSTTFTGTKQQDSLIKTSGVYVLVGGAGEIGRTVCDYILETFDTKVILLGRSEALKKRVPAGAYYYQCDSTDALSVAKVFKEIRQQFVAINGIMYLAGITADGYAKNKSTAAAAKVLEVKIEGIRNIDKETKYDALDFMVFFSSIAAIYGNIGQIDYAAANAFLDDYARYRENQRSIGNRHGITKSINWPLWKNGGMQINADTEAFLQKKWGMQAMPDEEGIKALKQILNSDCVQASVIYKVSSENNITKVENTPNSNRISRKTLLENLTQLAAKLVKMNPLKVISHVELGDYGFDSILYTQFCNEINALYGLDITPTLFFNYPTLDDLTAHLESNYALSMEGGQQFNEENENIAAATIQEEEKNAGSDRYSGKAEQRKQVAIVGMSGRFPGAENVDQLWEHLRNKEDLITEVPESRWDWRKYYGDPQQKENTTLCKWGGFLDGIDEFDPLFFNISPIEAELMDPQQRLVLQEVYHALEDAAIAIHTIKGTDTGVFIGVSSSDYSTLLKEQTNQTGMAQFATGSAHSVLVNRLSYIFDLHGPSEPIDTACSSSLIAIHRAAEHIRNGHGTMAIAGGVNAILSPELTLSFSQAGMLSKDGRCKTFDQTANGYVRGEGVGILILKDLDQAIEDKNPIYGILKGSAENHGGKANTLTSPNPKAQQNLLIKAYKTAGIDPRAVSYIEAHGTGTPLGDPIETEGLKLAFETLYKDSESSYGQQEHCAIGSIKTNIGHLEAAAGVAGAIKVLMAMKNNKIPGNPLLFQPNHYLKLENTPFYLQKDTTDWEVTKGQRKIAGVSSFGFGGANAHIIIEEYKEDKPVNHFSEAIPVCVLSAKDADGLNRLAKLMTDYLSTTSDDAFQEVLYTLQSGREAMEYRLAFVVNNRKGCINRLNEFLEANDTIPHMHIGNNEDTISSADKEELHDSISNWSINKDAATIAKLWSKGANIDWKLLYENKTPQKIHLPTYPFKKDRYWFVATRNLNETGAKSCEKEHPLVEKMVNETTYESVFSGTEPIFASHKVNGINVLPGAAQIEWIREVGNRYKKQAVTRITDVVFREPIQENDNKLVEVVVALEETKEGLTYNFRKKSDPTSIYSNGIIQYDLLPVTKAVTIDHIALRLPNSLSKQEYYKLLDDKGITYGKHFQGIQEIMYSDKEVLTQIYLAETEEKYMLSPFLLDSAVQTVMGLSFGFDKKNPTKLPFRVKEVRIYKKLPQQFWSYAKKIEPTNGEALPTYDVDLINENGEILVQFEGFVALNIKTTPIAEQQPCSIEDLMYVSEWKREALFRQEETPSGNALIISYKNNNSKIANELRAYLMHKNIAIFYSDDSSEIPEEITDVYIVHDAPAAHTSSILETFWESNELEVFKQLKKLLSSPYAHKDLNITVLSDRTQKVLAGDKVQCHGSGILGLMSSLAKEQSNWNVRIIDVDASNKITPSDIMQLLKIPYDPNGEIIAYRNQNTYIRDLYPLETQPITSKFKKGGVYVILGGAGGIGKVTSAYLAEKYQAQIIWLGRSPENETILKAQEEIAQWGPKPVYIQCNAILENEVKGAYHKIKQIFKNINGVFHSALVLRDSLIHQMDESTFVEVFESKATSSHYLIDVFARESLDFICFYSSMQSQVNALGQANYAAACMYKDSFAYTVQQKFNIPVQIINWGYWGSVGVVASDGYRNKMEQLGIGSIEADEGMAILEEVIAQEHQQVIAAKFI
ncbi:SDR family NAD(P)-dependent oxidoreductase [Flavobacterium poyangense]|uniref:SDR family NAD(P)-dependent oxidoreductase n=1 Tax=Flavobacterium poyangense TaxID=2204302 RepID=UPI00141E9D4B|nr:SDR family NAD(P)-dependent oxidoreductase [Flavobacterium sp. JXAS1]